MEGRFRKVFTDKIHAYHDNTPEPQRLINFLAVFAPFIVFGAWAPTPPLLLLWFVIAVLLIADRRRYLNSRVDKHD